MTKDIKFISLVVLLALVLSACSAGALSASGQVVSNTPHPGYATGDENGK